NNPLDNSSQARALRLLKYGLVSEARSIYSNARKLPGGNAPLQANGFARPPYGTPDFKGGRGPNAGCHTQPITPLTNNYADLKRKVRNLQAEGNTNIMEGVVWGMRVLSPHAPFTEGKDPEDVPELEKVM